MSPERKILQILEMSGLYVFHGTGEDIDVLEPQRQKDGPAAVFASSSADYAIFFAIVSKKNCPLGRHASVADFEFKDSAYQVRFKASAHTLSQIDDSSSGWVYVFDKEQFRLRQEGGIEYANHQPVRPHRRVRVTRKDLLGHIDVQE